MMFEMLSEKVRRGLRWFMMSPQQRAEEWFLGQATDLADLEWRMKELRNRRNCYTLVGC